MKGIFGDLFDFNHNGKLEASMQVIEFTLFQTMMDNNENDDSFLVD